MIDINMNMNIYSEQPTDSYHLHVVRFPGQEQRHTVQEPEGGERGEERREERERERES